MMMLVVVMLLLLTLLLCCYCDNGKVGQCNDDVGLLGNRGACVLLRIAKKSKSEAVQSDQTIRK